MEAACRSFCVVMILLGVSFWRCFMGWDGRGWLVHFLVLPYCRAEFLLDVAYAVVVSLARLGSWAPDSGMIYGQKSWSYYIIVRDLIAGGNGEVLTQSSSRLFCHCYFLVPGECWRRDGMRIWGSLAGFRWFAEGGRRRERDSVNLLLFHTVSSCLILWLDHDGDGSDDDVESISLASAHNFYVWVFMRWDEYDKDVYE